jgi:signal transduction histidine kinase
MFFISKKKFDTEIARRTMETCEQITSEMGAELHDDLIQKLTIFRLYMDRLERSSSDPEEINALLITMRGDFDIVSQSIRKISRRLMPVSMEGDSFQTRIHMLCQNMEMPGAGNVHFEVKGEEQSMTELSQRYIHRIIQELIHNAFKHSSAWHIWVRLKWTATQLQAEVEDDGTGFSKTPEFINELKKKNNTLRMRSTAIGATISYTNGTKGLLATLSYPIESAAE